MRVLLVDDEALALDRLTALFADIDATVVGTARSGEEALVAIARLRPDLVILDIQMPGRNGLRTAAEIGLDPRPEIVFVTAHEHYAPDAFDVDAADYLLKPVRFDRLRQAVERARRRRALRDRAGRAGELEAQLHVLRGHAGEVPEDTDFWVAERNGLRRVAVETINWIEAGRAITCCCTPTCAAICCGPRWRRWRRNWQERCCAASTARPSSGPIASPRSAAATAPLLWC